MREYIPNYAGSFTTPEKWELFARIAEDWDTRDVGAWREALVFYESRNGDAVLLAPTGAMAWWLLAENEVVPFQESLLDVVAYYSNYISQRYPFSSWEPPERSAR